MKTEIVFHQDYLKKYAIQDFKDRLEILFELFQKHGALKDHSMKIIDSTPVPLETVMKIHDKNLINELSKTKWLDISRLSAGGALVAARDILEKRIQNAFVLIPVGGHHAGPHTHWGFCYLNETAFVVDYLREQGVEKILYIDQDYHHADGTEKFFKSDPNFFYICLHGARELGHFVKYKSHWNHLDIALPVGIGGIDYYDVMNKAIEISLIKFEPEFIITYMGYDGHYLDSFNNKRMRIDQYTYYKLMLLYKNLAREFTQDKLLGILGGGYNSHENAKAIFNAIMVLSENWDFLIDVDSKGVQASDPEAEWKTSSILRKLEQAVKK